LTAVSFTGNGKTATVEQQQNVLQLVRTLELQSRPSTTLLSNPTETERQLLNGTWFLQYTSPSTIVTGNETSVFPDAWTPVYAKEGNVETLSSAAAAPRGGTVTAAGVTVDTSNRVVRQTFDIATSTVINQVTTDWGHITVSGTFRPSPNVPNRALVAFDTALIEWKFNMIGFKINLGFVFAILAMIRQSRDNGWLETTYVDERMRLGRGNKGTLFVLTRDQDAVKP
jgi:PAP_fibrillin